MQPKAGKWPYLDEGSGLVGLLCGRRLSAATGGFYNLKVVDTDHNVTHDTVPVIKCQISRLALLRIEDRSSLLHQVLQGGSGMVPADDAEAAQGFHCQP